MANRQAPGLEGSAVRRRGDLTIAVLGWQPAITIELASSNRLMKILLVAGGDPNHWPEIGRAHV